MSEQELWVTHYPVELRSDTRGSRTIVGTAAVFNSDSRNLGGFIERVLPSFCDRSLAAGWAGIVCRFNHDDNYVLGNTDSGTLRVSRDQRGMNYECDLPRSQEMVREAIERGDIRTSSMAFTLVPGVDDTWEPRDGLPLRTLSGGTILDVAPVAIAAYAETSCALRSLAHFAEADYEDVKKAARDGELRKFVIRTDGAPPVPPAPGSEPAPEPVAAKTTWGRQALIKTLAAKPNGPDRLLDTLAAQQFTGAERLAQTTVEGQLATAQAELTEARAEVTRLSDPALIERESAQAELDLADARARDELDRLNGSLSGAAALRILEDARPPGCAPYVSPVPEAQHGGLVSRETKPEPEPAPQYRTLTGREALRRLEAMRPPALFVEASVNRGRACDQYSAEQGGRF
jgi:uncharacterized protein